MLVQLTVSRSLRGTISSLDGSMGEFFSDIGSITGKGSFTSAGVTSSGGVIDIAFTWGTPFALEVGLERPSSAMAT